MDKNPGPLGQTLGCQCDEAPGVHSHWLNRPAERFQAISPAWEELLREASTKADALIEKKSNDYGHFSLYPDIVLASLIWVKGRRILEIVQKQKTPNFESIEDSCLDILNYVRFLYAKQKKGE